MENVKVTKHWGTAAVFIAVVVFVAAAILLFLVPARAQQAQACCPAVIIQWQPQSIVEAKFRERILKDNVLIEQGLKAIADNPSMSPKDAPGYFKNTYFRNPRLLEGRVWVEGWDQVLPLLKRIIRSGSAPVITSVSVVLDYLPYAGAERPEEDMDVVAHIQFTFSTGPDDPLGGGELKHSRLCPII